MLLLGMKLKSKIRKKKDRQRFGVHQRGRDLRVRMRFFRNKRNKSIKRIIAIKKLHLWKRLIMELEPSQEDRIHRNRK